MDLFCYDVIGRKVGTKWRKYMKTCMLFCFYVHITFIPVAVHKKHKNIRVFMYLLLLWAFHYIIVENGLLLVNWLQIHVPILVFRLAPRERGQCECICLHDGLGGDPLFPDPPRPGPEAGPDQPGLHCRSVLGGRDV